MNRAGSLSDPSSPLPVSQQRPQGLLSPALSGVLSPRAGDQPLERIDSSLAKGLESRPSEIEPAQEKPGDKSLPHKNRVQALQDRVKLLETELIDIENTNKLRQVHPPTVSRLCPCEDWMS